MSLSLHQLAPAKGARTKAFRVGRGHGSGRGKTAGRGTKGQRSRTGGRNKLKLKGMRAMLLSYPKMKGFQSRYAKDITVTVTQVERAFESGALVSFATLRQHGLMERSDRGAKIVGNGQLSKKLTIASEVHMSASARTLIEKAGGSIQTQKKSDKKR